MSAASVQPITLEYENNRNKCCQHGDHTVKTVALTFDDGPNPEFTCRILDLLQKEDCHASFFLIGRWAEKCPEIVKRMLAKGHCIGSHSYTHGGDFDGDPTKEETHGEFVRGHEVVENIAKKPVRYMRIPGFGYNDEDKKYPARCSEICLELKDKITKGDLIIVDASPIIRGDYEMTSDQIRGAIANAPDDDLKGSIIVLHDGSSRPSQLKTRPQPLFDALQDVIDNLKSGGFRLVSLDEMDLQFETQQMTCASQFRGI